jgi:disulfide oxidoreductase YuzD
MEVKIGVVYSAKEHQLEVEGTEESVAACIEAGLSGPMLWLTDTKGRRVGVPTDKIAYIEILGEDAAKKVGFGR